MKTQAAFETAKTMHSLDNPIWHSLSTLHAHFAEGDELAKRYPPEVTLLAAMGEPTVEAYAALAKTLQRAGAALFLDQPPQIPAGWITVHAAPLVQMVCEKPNLAQDGFPAEKLTPADVPETDWALEDRWIFGRLKVVEFEVRRALDSFNFANAARVLYAFAWDEFCSLYVEIIKHRLADESKRPAAQSALVSALDVLLRLLHPIVPFITEDVWQRLADVAPQRGWPRPSKTSASIMVSPWPVVNAGADDSLLKWDFDIMRTLLTGLRNIRSANGIASDTQIRFQLRGPDDKWVERFLERIRPYLELLANALGNPYRNGEDLDTYTEFRAEPFDVFVDLAGHIDLDAERARGEKELQNLRQQIEAKEKKLANENFVSRAPADVVQKERESLSALRDRLESTMAALEKLKRA